MRTATTVVALKVLCGEEERLLSRPLPTVIARDGVSRVTPVALSGSERKALEASAETLKRYIATSAGGRPEHVR
jgi:malate/lactate dehydrogenase